MIEDNKDLKHLSRSQLNEQYIYAIRHSAEWLHKLEEVQQEDSKAVCRREHKYWSERMIAIQHELARYS